MKKALFLSLMAVWTLSGFAQWDDVYYMPKKKDKANYTKAVSNSNTSNTTIYNSNDDYSYEEGFYERQIKEANGKNSVTVVDERISNVLGLPNGKYEVEVDRYSIHSLYNEFDDITNIYNLSSGYYTIYVSDESVVIQPANRVYYTGSYYNYNNYWDYPYYWDYWGRPYRYWGYPSWYWHSSRFYWDYDYYWGWCYYPWGYGGYNNWWWHSGYYNNNYHTRIHNQMDRRRTGEYRTASDNYRRYTSATRTSRMLDGRRTATNNNIRDNSVRRPIGTNDRGILRDNSLRGSTIRDGRSISGSDRTRSSGTTIRTQDNLRDRTRGSGTTIRTQDNLRGSTTDRRSSSSFNSDRGRGSNSSVRTQDNSSRSSSRTSSSSSLSTRSSSNSSFGSSGGSTRSSSGSSRGGGSSSSDRRR